MMKIKVKRDSLPTVVKKIESKCVGTVTTFSHDKPMGVLGFHGNQRFLSNLSKT